MRFKFLCSLLGLLLFIPSLICAQDYSKTTSALITEKDFANYNLLQKRNISLCIDNAIREVKLIAYANPKFTKEIENEQYKRIGSVEASLSPEPEDKSEFYALIDTVIIMEMSPENIFGFTINFIKGILALHITPNESVYLKLYEVRKVLNNEQNHFISNYKSIIHAQTGTTPSIMQFTDSILTTKGFILFKSTAKMLYNLGISKKVKAYKNIELQDTFSQKELELRGSFQSVIQIESPKGNEDFYDIIDSITIHLLNSDSISAMFAYYKWQISNRNVNLELLAIAPGCNPIIGGVELNPKSLFLISENDARRWFNDEMGYNYIKSIFISTLQKNGVKEVEESDFLIWEW